MNLLYLCDEYPPCQHGGIGTVTQNLAREMVLKGHQVSVCGFYPYYRKALPFENDFGVKVYRRFYGNRLSLKLSRNKLLGRIINIEPKFNSYIRFLKDLILKYKIDLIEIPDFNEAFRYTGPRVIYFPDFNICKIIKLHGSYSFLNYSKGKCILDKGIYQKEERLIFSASKVIAVSNFAKDISAEIFNYNKNIKVINNGIQVISRPLYNGNTVDSTVVFAGRISEEKGVLNLIKAWGSVIETKKTARLLLYGRGDSKTFTKIKNLITREVQGSIEIKGFITNSELLNVYNSASCAIFPSYFETFGMAPIEAMQVGCPTIYSKRARGEQLITNYENGLLIDPDNTDEIAEAIVYMLNNRSSAKLMGENGAKTVYERFNISLIADQHTEVYSGLINQMK